MSNSDAQPLIVGNPTNFWLYTPRTGFDLTHPPTPTSAAIHPRLTLQTTNTPITISPQKTALVIIDMQNYFLAQPFRTRGAGHDAEDVLLRYGIPAARRAGIQILWLTWGLTEEDLERMNPTSVRMFGLSADGMYMPSEKPTPGEDIGLVEVDGGEKVDGGRVLMRGTWNAELHAPMAAEYGKGREAKVPDVRFHKNRMSGMCDEMTEATDFLQRGEFKTLLFAGVNTDQCVLSTLQDANLKGFDTILLRDGAGTRSGREAQRVMEWNCERSWGFVTTCESLHEAVQALRFEEALH